MPATHVFVPTGWPRIGCRPNWEFANNYWGYRDKGSHEPIAREALRHSMRGALAGACTEGAAVRGRLHGILSPHAPVQQVAGVYAEAYLRLGDLFAQAVEGGRSIRVVVLAANHLKDGEKQIIWTPGCTHFKMPFADLEVDKELTGEVYGVFPDSSVCVFGSVALMRDQYPQITQLLWLSALAEELNHPIRVAPLTLGIPLEGYEEGRDGFTIGQRVAEIAGQNPNDEIVLVATADLAHGRNLEQTRGLDGVTMGIFENGTRVDLYRHFRRVSEVGGFPFDYPAKMKTHEIPLCSRSAAAALFGMKETLAGGSIRRIGYGTNHAFSLPAAELVGAAALAVESTPVVEGEVVKG